MKDKKILFSKRLLGFPASALFFIAAFGGSDALAVWTCTNPIGVTYQLVPNCPTAGSVLYNSQCIGNSNIPITAQDCPLQKVSTSTAAAAPATPTKSTAPTTPSTSQSTSSISSLLSAMSQSTTSSISQGSTSSTKTQPTTPVVTKSTTPPSPVNAEPTTPVVAATAPVKTSTVDTIPQTQAADDTPTPASTTTPTPSPDAVLAAAAAQERTTALKNAADLRVLMTQLKEKNQQAAEYYASGGTATLDSTGSLQPPDRQGSSNFGSAREPSSVGDTARLNAQQKSGDDAAAGNGGDNSQLAGNAADDSYWNYMAENGRSQMVDELRLSKTLREKLRKRLAGMVASGDPEKKKVEASLATLLREAEKKPANKIYGDVQPLTTEEAFAMDADETNRGVRNLLSQLHDSSDERLSLDESLFERVKSTNDRSVRNGLLRLQAAGKSK